MSLDSNKKKSPFPDRMHADVLPTVSKNTYWLDYALEALSRRFPQQEFVTRFVPRYTDVSPNLRSIPPYPLEEIPYIGIEEVTTPPEAVQAGLPRRSLEYFEAQAQILNTGYYVESDRPLAAQSPDGSRQVNMTLGRWSARYTYSPQPSPSDFRVFNMIEVHRHQDGSDGSRQLEETIGIQFGDYEWGRPRLLRHPRHDTYGVRARDRFTVPDDERELETTLEGMDNAEVVEFLCDYTQALCTQWLDEYP